MEARGAMDKTERIFARLLTIERFFVFGRSPD
jgi:hypothetical protein